METRIENSNTVDWMHNIDVKKISVFHNIDAQ